MAKHSLRTIYQSGPFQPALICENRSLGTGVLEGRKTANIAYMTPKAYIGSSLTMNFRAKNYPVKNTPSEEYAKQRISRENNSPAKNFPP
jgi:hypothetical protein